MFILYFAILHSEIVGIFYVNELFLNIIFHKVERIIINLFGKHKFIVYKKYFSYESL